MATGLAALGLIATTIVYLNKKDTIKVETEPVPAKFETICIAGAYERTNGLMVVDMFAPTVGVETIEDVSKETYEQIKTEIGACQ